jgi:2-isopropylmalate synthase
MAEKLVIFDTTLRDGEQAPGFSMRIEEKIRLARQLETLGVDIIEAGFPIASEADAEAVRQVSQVLGATVALGPCAAGDIDRAAWALAPARRARIHARSLPPRFAPVEKLRMTREACLTAATDPVVRGRSPMTWGLNEDATRRPRLSLPCH